MKNRIDLREYQKFVKKIAKKFENRNEEIMTWGLGISGEAGDVASCIKKTFAHENDQKTGIRENIGDTFWYMAAICNFFGWDIEEIIGENMAKLKKRCPKGFATKKAKRKMTDWGEK
ncbi:MAG: nucleoside triphosphate pyrophosphohydrolase family protein [Patescibacteria group bacterium]|nr:nucleoside triphosphate pyrophosphohydrolase family protein [Patescibacteria group bacterium]